jgi:hypothetical protein
MDHGSARFGCLQKCGDLVSIGSAAENALVRSLLPTSSSIWFGLNDGTTEGTFTYLSGEPVTYTNWYPGEPNDSGGNEDCAELYSNGQWNDDVCSNPRPFVCEVIEGSFDNRLPFGWFDGVNPAVHLASGWVFDPDSLDQAVQLHLYTEEPPGTFTLAGVAFTTEDRPDVNATYGITGVHGWRFTIPESLRTGTHTLYAFALDGQGCAHANLGNSPVTFSY